MKPKSTDTFSTQSYQLAAMHKDSHTISKYCKPKIRIIHIVAPEIIKTDVEHFRELVQRLTGKPTEKEEKGEMKKYSTTEGVLCTRDLSIGGRTLSGVPMIGFRQLNFPYHEKKECSRSDATPPIDLNAQFPKPSKILELQSDEIQMFQSLPQMMQEAEEIFGGDQASNSYYLHGFGDMDCFSIQDLVEFPDLIPFKSSHINTLGEQMPLCFQ